MRLPAADLERQRLCLKTFSFSFRGVLSGEPSYQMSRTFCKLLKPPWKRQSFSKRLRETLQRAAWGTLHLGGEESCPGINKLFSLRWRLEKKNKPLTLYPLSFILNKHLSTDLINLDNWTGRISEMVSDSELWLCKGFWWSSVSNFASGAENLQERLSW